MSSVVVQLDELFLQAGSSFLRVGIRSPELLQRSLQSNSLSTRPSISSLTSCLANGLSDLFTKGLSIKSFSDLSVLLIEPIMCPDYVRDAAFQALLIVLGVARVRSITHSMACLMSTARSTAFIIDIAASESTVSPIVSGCELLQPSLLYPLQGKIPGLNSIYACAAMLIFSALSHKMVTSFPSSSSRGRQGASSIADNNALVLIPEFTREYSLDLLLVQSSPIDTSGSYDTSDEWWPLEGLNRSCMFAKSSKQAACEYAFSLWIDSVVKMQASILEDKSEDVVIVSVPSNLSQHSGCALPETISISASLWSYAFLIPLDPSSIHKALECVLPNLQILNNSDKSLAVINSLFLRSVHSCKKIGTRSSSSIQSVALDALLSAPIDARRSLSSSIVLSGWAFSIPGFSLRFFQSLSNSIDPTFDIGASLLHHAEVGAVKGFANGIAQSRTREIDKHRTKSTSTTYACLRPLLPLLCSSNLTLPSITAFTGAISFLRALSLTQRLVPESNVASTGSKLSTSDKLRISDAFTESSITRTLLLSRKHYRIIGQIAVPGVEVVKPLNIALSESVGAENVITKVKTVVDQSKPPFLPAVAATSSATSSTTSSSLPIDARTKLTALSSKLNKAKK